MDMQTPEGPTEAAQQPRKEEPKSKEPSSARIPSIVVAVVIAAVTSLSIWYLVRPAPLLVRGEVDATRLDIAARVDGRVADIPGGRANESGAEARLPGLAFDRTAPVGSGSRGRRGSAILCGRAADPGRAAARGGGVRGILSEP